MLLDEKRATIIAAETWQNDSKQQRILDVIPGGLVWVAFAFCIVSGLFFPRVLLWIAAIIGVYTAIRFAVAGWANMRGLRQIREWEQRDWQAYYQQHKSGNTLAWDDVHHMVIVPNYNEPIDLLRRTLSALSQQYRATSHMTIVLAMEERESNHNEKATLLQSEFERQFKHVIITTHPDALEGEFASKSPNEAWAARQAKTILVDEYGYDLGHICVTTMDADTRWHPQHFEALTALFALDDARRNTFWQAPIRYHGNIWEINPLLRIVNAYATAFELAYLASPFWMALPMSSYSLSLKLLDDCNYWDGDVIADEWHMFIKAFFARHSELTLSPVMLPFLADATTGKNLWGEIRERYLQTLRHAWGSKEITYAADKIIHRDDNTPLLPSLRLFMRISHDIFMAGAGWVLVTLGAQLPLILHREIAPFQIGEVLQAPSQTGSIIIAGLLANPVWLIIALAGLLVITLALVFWVLDIGVRPPRTDEATAIERIWSALSLPLMPIVTVIVVAIPVIVAQTRIMLGQKLVFRVSKKV